jgi:hypothetical protein
MLFFFTDVIELHKTDHLLLTVSRSQSIMATLGLTPIVSLSLRETKKLHKVDYLLLTVTNSQLIRVTLVLRHNQ